jgi:hypothetical protein
LHTADDKLQWEVAKLQAETENLSRPFLRQPTFWIGLGTLILSVSTNIVQFNSGERNRQLAEIKKESLQLEAKQLERQKGELESAVADQRSHLAQVGDEVGRTQAALDKLKSELSTAEATKGQMAALKSVTELQEKTRTLSGIVENTSRNLAQVASPRAREPTRDTGRAAQYELQAFQALVAREFSKAQQLFQSSEDAANGYRYSYEWARLLRTRSSDLATPEGQNAVLQFALSKGYASYAPEELRRRLHEISQ